MSSTIRTIESLQNNLDSLYFNISEYCKTCGFDDCEGMVWLLPGEVDYLLAKGVPILTVNGDLSFIHSFPELDGYVNVQAFQPRCLLYHDGQCAIYSQRPFICRLYPLGFATEKDRTYLVLHKECRFTEQLEFHPQLILNAIGIFNRVSPDLLISLLRIYFRVEELCAYPYGPNSYTKVMELQV